MSIKSKRIKDLQWESVAFEGFPVSIAEEGFVGLEECKTYDLDKNIKKTKIKKQPNKRQISTLVPELEFAKKKIKLSNGFIVESCDYALPSRTNDEITSVSDKESQNGFLKDVIKIKNTNTENEVNANDKQGRDGLKPKSKSGIKITKLGEDISNNTSTLTPIDMLSWAEFKLPEEITKALMELGYQRPTKIQELTLPAALHGRRDILGAAETGSGKTLAFGLPILTGIMKLKEKAAMGLDVYEVPYKKSSGRKKPLTNNLEQKDNKKNKTNLKNQKPDKPKESSEEGYSSEVDEEQKHESESSDEDLNDDVVDEVSPQSDYNDDDYLEEVEVPLRKRVLHSDDEEDSNDSDGDYVHLSDMLDSDDIADNSDDDEKDNQDSDVVESEADDQDNEAADSGNDEEVDEDVDENLEGVGCVKVIDNIEVPNKVPEKPKKPLYALILTPTRELAVQVSNHLKAVAKYTGIHIATIVGGMAMVKQERLLRQGPDIIVATPGRLWEMCQQLPHLPYIRFLAIDETDRMVEPGHFKELTPLLERLNSDDERRTSRQNFVFSATLTVVHDLPMHLKGKKVTKGGKIVNRKVEKMTSQQKIQKLIDLIGMSEPKVVDVTTQNLGAAETLTESKISCSLEDKDVYLYYILKRHPGRTIVFCNSIGSVKRLAELLTLLRLKPLPLHANMAQKQRLKNLERFRDQPTGVLVATDVAARGLDVPGVDHVVHYQVPRTAENYVHRSGRTARANKEGLTILMMEPSEAFTYLKLCKTLNKAAEPPTFPTCARTLPGLRSAVHAARDLLALQQSHRHTAAAVGWREKMAREMDIIIDDDVVPVKQSPRGLAAAVTRARRTLDALLSRPAFPANFSFKYPTLNEVVKEEPQVNALQAMKNAIETGEVKKQKRKSKNASLLKLGKQFRKK